MIIRWSWKLYGAFHGLRCVMEWECFIFCFVLYTLLVLEGCCTRSSTSRNLAWKSVSRNSRIQDNENVMQQVPALYFLEDWQTWRNAAHPGWHTQCNTNAHAYTHTCTHVHTPTSTYMHTGSKIHTYIYMCTSTHKATTFPSISHSISYLTLQMHCTMLYTYFTT